MQASFEQLLTQAVTILDSTPKEADAWYLLSLVYVRQGYHEESIEALIQALNYVDKLDVNKQTSRLKGKRAKAEIVLAQHYTQSTKYQDKAKEWCYKAWSHLSPHDEDWTSMITYSLKWSIHTKEVDLLKKQFITSSIRGKLQSWTALLNQALSCSRSLDFLRSEIARPLD